MYSGFANPDIAGFFQASSHFGVSTFSTWNSVDVNVQGSGVSLDGVLLGGGYAEQAELTGPINFRQQLPDNFTVTYDFAYEQTPSLAIIAGRYFGLAATPGGREIDAIRITGTGAIIGSNASGCTYTGTAAPRAEGNAYNTSITYGGGACFNGTQTVTGLSYLQDGVLNVMALNPDRTNGVVMQPSNANASPGGIWQGTDPISGLAIFGVIAENGELQFFRSDGAQYSGAVTTSGDAISGSFEGVLRTGGVFADGSNHGNGTITGTIQPRQAIAATIGFLTAGGTLSSGTTSVSFNALYASGSSLAAIAGSYLDPSTNATVDVSSSGALSAHDPNTGCAISGQVSIIDSLYDAYQLRYSFSGCLGNAASLNGTTAIGLGVLDTTVNPVVAYIGGGNSGAIYVLSGAYTKQ